MKFMSIKRVIFFFFNLYNRYRNCEFRAKELANFIKCTLVKSLYKKNRDQHFPNCDNIKFLWVSHIEKVPTTYFASK